jgi:phosphate transport system substrate-binding protein
MRKMITGAAAAAVMAFAAVADVKVDPRLPYYTPTQGVTGKLKSVGSDTMNNLMTAWFESFEKFYPNVQAEVEGKGSSTAPPALIEGAAQFGPMSRPMKASEIDEFEKAFGYKPTLLKTGIDALAVYVHKDCPLEEISIEQITQVFSVAGADMTWGDLGVSDAAYRNKPISLYGRNSASGTYGYFKDVALNKNDYKPTVKEQPGSSAVVQGVANDRFAMGYSGLGYRTSGVKALKVSLTSGDEAFEPSAENALSGEYPIARFLYVYVNKNPNQSLEPLRAEFIKLVFSQQGQEVVIKDGYFPVPAELAKKELANLGIAWTGR